MVDRLRILITVARGGSTAFLRTFENNPQVHGYYQPIKSGLRATGKPDYSIYELEHEIYSKYPDKFIVAKEVLGPFESESNLDPFGVEENIVGSQPLFIFREPLENYNSWKRILKGRENYQPSMEEKLLQNFLISYQNNWNLFNKAISLCPEASCCTLEKIGKNPDLFFEKLCQKWQIPYEPQMLEWNLPWGENTTFWSEKIKLDLMNRRQRLVKITESIRDKKTFVYHPLAVENLEITDYEKQTIQTELATIYSSIVDQSNVYY